MEKSSTKQKETCVLTMHGWYMPNTFYSKGKRKYLPEFTHRGDDNGKIKVQADMITYLLNQLHFNRYRLQRAIIYSNGNKENPILLTYEHGTIQSERISDLQLQNPEKNKFYRRVWREMMSKIINNPIVIFNKQNNEQKQNS